MTARHGCISGLTHYVLSAVLAAIGCSADTEPAGETCADCDATTAAETGDTDTTTTGPGDAGTVDTAALADGAAPGDVEGVDAETPPDAATPETDPAALRPLSVSADGRIVDDLDREVLLRGVNVTTLGEYWQGDPDHAPTQALTAADWDAMAAQGFSVIRLVVHWSRLEPIRGTLDVAYLDQIDEAVKAAAARRLYTVIDMHQDAYTATLFTPPGTQCTPPATPAKGWDGAPAWATRHDGLDTCVTGDRNSSPAVTAAWNHFYDNTDGIRDRFVATWGGLAARFAGRAEVAGYDLLNEPEVSRPASELADAYNALLAETMTAIRAAEAGAPVQHLLIVEPAFAAGHPAFGAVIPEAERLGVPLENVVSGPHNYAEAIENGLGLTIEGMNDLYLNLGLVLGVPTWIGEHGFWSVDATTLDKLDRYAADEDRRVLGGAWWQWRQPCGDPHSVPIGGYAATGATNEQHHLNGLGCPGDVDLGPTEPFLRVVRRAYPRAAPGRITRLESPWSTGALVLEATGAAAGAELVLWTPTGADTHTVAATGLGPLTEHIVPGGRLVTGSVVKAGGYSVTITPK
jgi:endoglycosylceramidase